MLRLRLMFYSIWSCSSSGEDTDSSGSLDLLLGEGGEELGLDDDGHLGESSFSEHFEEALEGEDI